MQLFSPVGWRVSLARALVCVGLSSGYLYGQSAWTLTDIGPTGATGSYTYASGTGTLAGAGLGVSGTADSFSFASTPTSGNVEIIAKVTSQTNPNNYATAGLMVRESLSPDSAQAYVAVSPLNGVNFISRVATGTTSNTTLGPSVAAPVWLRMVKSGSSIAGYESPDGVTWTLVGSATFTISGSCYMGLAVSSHVSGTLGTAVYSPIVPMTNVPQRSASMQLWLRGDVGVTLSGTNRVSQWTDQSTYGYNAVQTGTGAQPTLTPGALNSLPGITFNGSQYLQFPAGLADFTAGASIFVVTKPTAASNNARFLDLGNGATSNNLTLARSGTTANSILYAYSAGTTSSVTGTNGLTLNQYQVVEAVHSGSASATLYSNAAQTGQGTLFNITNVTRTLNFLGVSSGTTSGFFQGDIVEALVYNSALSATDRQSVEVYLAGKYGLTAAQPAVITPTFNLTTTIYSAPQSLTITSQPGASIYYTLDGSTPSPASTPYTGPVTISTSGTVKAIATLSGFTNSAVSSLVVTIDPSSAGVVRNGLALWLRSDMGLTVTGSNVSQWADQSGNANNAVQSGTSNQPVLQAAQLNGQAVVKFDGVNDWLAIPDAPSLKPSQITVFVVGKASTHPAPFIIKSTSTSWLDGYGITRSGSNAYMFVNSSMSSGTGAAMAANVYGIIAGRYDLQQVRIAVLGSTMASTAYSSTISNVNTPVYLGSQAGTDSLDCSIAEVLLYGRALSEQEMLLVEGYLQQKYLLGYPPVVNPVFSNTSGTTFALPSQVALSIPAIPPGVNIYYTTDGSAPTTSSPVYTGPIWVTYTSTIKAFATAPGYTASGTVSGTFNLSGTAWPAPTPGGTPPTINLQLPTNAY